MVELAVARIVSVRGLQGQVKIQLLTDFPELRLVPGAKFGDLEIAHYQRLNDRHYLTFTNITERQQAETLVGRTLTIDADTDMVFDPVQRSALNAADQFRVTELIGLTAYDMSGLELGHIVDVRLLPAQDQLVLRKNPGLGNAEQNLVRIPLVKPLVPEIDLVARTVRLDLPLGLL
jgi:16S rRNA processing protein RimM